MSWFWEKILAGRYLDFSGKVRKRPVYLPGAIKLAPFPASAAQLIIQREFIACNNVVLPNAKEGDAMSLLTALCKLGSTKEKW